MEKKVHPRQTYHLDARATDSVKMSVEGALY
jgi:hypothetical protein